jgi:nucleotide-binding universal stress UspA family protein
VFEHVLVAVDGSQEAEAGLAFAVRLAASCGGRLTVVEVLEPAYDLWASVPEPVPGLDRWLLERRGAVEDRLAGLAAGAPSGVAVETRIVEGKPAPALLDLIAELSPDLVVAGTHGVGLGRFLLGSVSQRLLEQAPCDLLLFRGRSPLEGPLRVIVGLDGSLHAERALAVAGPLASALSASLVLAHVIADRIPFGGIEVHGVRELLRERGTKLLREAREQVVAPVETVVEDLREGTARLGLIAACEEYAPAIAVVGSRGIHGFHGLLVGSTARDLVNHGPCPVLVVRARVEEE